MALRRGVSAAVFVAASLAWSAGLFGSSAAVASIKYVPCAPIVIGGKQWLIYDLSLPCSTADSIVRTLSKKPAPHKPTYEFPGTYDGLVCIRPGTAIICVAKNPQRAVEGIPK